MGKIQQFASVYTISHTVRIYEKVIEDPLKAKLLSSFRCKLPTFCSKTLWTTQLHMMIDDDYKKGFFGGWNTRVW